MPQKYKWIFIVLLILGDQNIFAKNMTDSNYSTLLDSTIFNNKSYVDDNNWLLKNVDLRSYNSKFGKKGYYQKIVRLNFNINFIPITLEIGMIDSNKSDVFFKYGYGKTIKYKQFPYVASEKKIISFFGIKNETSRQLANSIIQAASNLKPVPSNPGSCPNHVIEYRADSYSEDTYFRYKIWCNIIDKESLAIITNCYLLISGLLEEKNIELMFLMPWEEMIVNWNSGKIKRFLTKK